MTSIWGIMAPKIDTALQGIFNRMTEIMPFSPKSTVNVHVNDEIAIGHSTIGLFHKLGYPMRLTENKLMAVCGIPIWENACCAPPLEMKLNEDAVFDAGLIQTACQGDFLGDIGGVYAFATWESNNRELCLGTDRLGFKSLYYMHDPLKNAVFFASRLRGITDPLDGRLQINWKAVLEFLHFGHPLDNKTFYKQINLVPPGTVISFLAGQIHRKKYWDINDIKIDDKMSYQDAVDINVAALSSSILRRIERAGDAKMIMLLSGGADSRRVLGELVKNNVKIDTYTTRGFSEIDNESEIAAEVAGTVGVKNTFFDLPQVGFVEKYWSRANSLLDYESCLHQWLLPLVDILPFKNAVNYDGIGGDLLIEAITKASGFYEEESFQKVQQMNIQNKASKIIGKPHNLEFLKNEIQFPLCQESIEQSVIESLKRYEKSENQLTLFFFMNRTRRSISLAPTRILQEKVESFCPFLDKDVLYATLSVPLKFRLKHSLRQDIINFAYPELSRVPYAKYKEEVSGYTRSIKKQHKKEKLRQLRLNITTHFLKSNRCFKPYAVAPKFFTSLAMSYFGYLRIPYEFSLSFSVFYEWFAAYGHKLKKPLSKGNQWY